MKNFLLDAIAKIREIIATKKHSIAFWIRLEHICVLGCDDGLNYKAYLNVELFGNEYYFHFQLGQNDVSTKTPKVRAYVFNTLADLTFDWGRNIYSTT